MKKIFVGMTIWQIVKSIGGILLSFLLVWFLIGSNPITEIQEREAATEAQYEYNKSLMHAASEKNNTAVHLDAYGNVVE